MIVCCRTRRRQTPAAQVTGTAALLLACAIPCAATDTSTKAVVTAETQTSTVEVTSAHARCPVCLHNRDLGCVDVDVTSETPRAEYGDRTFHFCSDECRREFERAPEKYRHAIAE